MPIERTKEKKRRGGGGKGDEESVVYPGNVRRVNIVHPPFFNEKRIYLSRGGGGGKRREKREKIVQRAAAKKASAIRASKTIAVLGEKTSDSTSRGKEGSERGASHSGGVLEKHRRESQDVGYLVSSLCGRAGNRKGGRVTRSERGDLEGSRWESFFE